MIRVVLDTNVLVSALLSSEGLPARVLLMAITSKEIQLCVSGDIYAENDEVIRRPRFKRSAHEIEAALGAIRERGIWVKPSKKVVASSDPDDNVFLECAEAANAHYLIAGNVRHFPGAWVDTKVVTLRQFLEDLI